MKAELTKEKIELLLKGRQSVDAHLSRKVEAEASFDILIQKKPSQRTEKAVSVDVAGAIEQKDMAVTSSIEQYQSEIKELGFEDVEEFRQFNEDMCLGVIKASLPLVQVCDHCKGLPNPPAPPCTQICGGKSFNATWTDSDDDINNIYKQILESERNLSVDYPDVVEGFHANPAGTRSVQGAQVYKGDKTRENITCPEGHGFVIEWQGIESRQGIDITWRF